MTFLPPIDSQAEHIDPKTGRPSKDFYNWIKSLTDTISRGFQSLVVGNPAGGNQGPGSINAESIYVNGVALTPAVVDPQLSSLLLINRQVSASTTLVLTDRSRGVGCVMLSAGQTVTIPTQAAVAFPIGSTVSFASYGGGAAYSLVPAAGVQLIWSPSGAPGTRAMGFSSVATIWKVADDYWMLSGSGIT